MNAYCDAPRRVTAALAKAGLLTLPALAENVVADAAEDEAIVITARPTEARDLPPQITLAVAALLDKAPTNLADALRGLPGVSVRPTRAARPSRACAVPRSARPRHF